MIGDAVQWFRKMYQTFGMELGPKCRREPRFTIDTETKHEAAIRPRERSDPLLGCGGMMEFQEMSSSPPPTTSCEVHVQTSYNLHQ